MLVWKHSGVAFFGKGICVTCDNFFTSRSVLELAKLKNFGILGTLRQTNLGSYLSPDSEIKKYYGNYNTLGKMLTINEMWYYDLWVK